MNKSLRVLIASDSYKGSISSADANAVILKAVKDYIPNCSCECVEIADGGEGTLEAINRQLNLRKMIVSVMNPLFKRIETYFLIDGETAYIEMAKASGITLIDYKVGNANITTSYGTGEMINKALNLNCKKIFLTVGGSATNDCGIGALAALGVLFIDENDCIINPIGQNMKYVRKIDIEGINPKLRDVEIEILCDVDNKLTGLNGATYVYGPQKGASVNDIKMLEEGMINMCNLLENISGKPVSSVKKLGAAGGITAALYSLCGARVVSGINTILSIIDFEKKVQRSDLIFTGEGSLDSQSLEGKVVKGISDMTLKCSKSLCVIAGSVKLTKQELSNAGIYRTGELISAAGSLSEAMSNPAQYIYTEVHRILSDIIKED